MDGGAAGADVAVAVPVPAATADASDRRDLPRLRAAGVYSTTRLLNSMSADANADCIVMSRMHKNGQHRWWNMYDRKMTDTDKLAWSVGR